MLSCGGRCDRTFRAHDAAKGLAFSVLDNVASGIIVKGGGKCAGGPPLRHCPPKREMVVAQFKDRRVCLSMVQVKDPITRYPWAQRIKSAAPHKTH